MRKLLSMAMLFVTAALLLAPAALAQTYIDTTPQAGETCPPGTAGAFGDPGTGKLICASKQGVADIEAGRQPSDAVYVSDMLTSTSAPTSSTPASSTAVPSNTPATTAALPSTGGPAHLLPIAGVLLVGGGLLGLRRYR
ncbi:MAG: LPXTG cell wall anchor domain-containing protein [Rubrobacteraceae bacterium]|uniref:LPXTG cell wall anchor domain-containing protein n=1 Tax=Rubrobacter naiadicus TaxID=1392641 RepID=UPI00235EB2AA|nr:LPXTG cell wall anchor domain-containing protein [Rubrobacter naiadicus]MBX6765174.1 LPXTG cell wall anchor domain-containing protein [Rubrobacteraceae bacterium]MCL6437459.1 LPXTG cell wall anchor domain-containing protein [Rubrobacteraceae bacterium]